MDKQNRKVERDYFLPPIERIRIAMRNGEDLPQISGGREVVFQGERISDGIIRRCVGKNVYMNPYRLMLISPFDDVLHWSSMTNEEVHRIRVRLGQERAQRLRVMDRSYRIVRVDNHG